MKEKKIVMFVSTKRAVTLYTKFLTLAGFPVLQMKGSMSNNQRLQNYSEFQNNKMILVTTDVSARGVDYPDVDLVLVAGTPQSTDVFVHQSGRTARAGKTGKCICLLHQIQSTFIDSCKSKGIKFVSALPQGDFLRAFLTMDFGISLNFEKIDKLDREVFLKIYVKELKKKKPVIDPKLIKEFTNIMKSQLRLKSTKE